MKSRMLLQILSVIIIALLFSTITMDSSLVVEANTEVNEQTVKNTFGNTNGNLNNEGWVAEQGDWIYYRNDAFGGHLYKVKTDGTQKTKLNDDDVSYINVIGDWIFYLNKIMKTSMTASYELCKIMNDGSSRTIILDNNNGISSMVVYGDWIYYDAGPISKIKTDGSQKTAMEGGYGSIISIDSNNLYTYSKGIYGTDDVYKMKLDNLRWRREFTDCRGYQMFADSDYIYYFRDHIGLGIRFGIVYMYRRPKDVDGRETLIKDVDIEAANVNDGWIYFANGDDSWKLYKMKVDGSEMQKISDDEIEGPKLNVANGWIYYKNYADEEFYKIRVDGTDRQLVEPY